MLNVTFPYANEPERTRLTQCRLSVLTAFRPGPRVPRSAGKTRDRPSFPAPWWVLAVTLLGYGFRKRRYPLPRDPTAIVAIVIIVYLSDTRRWVGWWVGESLICIQTWPVMKASGLLSPSHSHCRECFGKGIRVPRHTYMHSYTQNLAGIRMQNHNTVYNPPVITLPPAPYLPSQPVLTHGSVRELTLSHTIYLVYCYLEWFTTQNLF